MDWYGGKREAKSSLLGMDLYILAPGAVLALTQSEMRGPRTRWRMRHLAGIRAELRSMEGRKSRAWRRRTPYSPPLTPRICLKNLFWPVSCSVASLHTLQRLLRTLWTEHVGVGSHRRPLILASLPPG